MTKRPEGTGTDEGSALGTDKGCLGKRAQGDVCPCRKQKEAASRVSALAFDSLASLSLEQASLFHCVDFVSP